MIREDILQTKLEKLEKIKEFGMDPYPEKSERAWRAENHFGWTRAFNATDGWLCFCEH
jgi:hypothetical protein